MSDTVLVNKPKSLALRTLYLRERRTGDHMGYIQEKLEVMIKVLQEMKWGNRFKNWPESKAGLIETIKKGLF